MKNILMRIVHIIEKIFAASAIALVSGLLLSSCKKDKLPSEEREKIILFRAGTAANSSKAAPSVYYMPQDGKFICRMYYKSVAESEDFDLEGSVQAWLKVDNKVGNSVYRKADYGESDIVYDSFNNDMYASTFYWRNRRPHAFLAWTDMNRYQKQEFVYSPERGMLKFEQDALIVMENDTVKVLSFDLTRGSRNSMEEQPDILQALTIHTPTSAVLQENRIDLVFRHQFSQVRVNIRNSQDNSVKIEAGQIKKVELLGVSEEGYISTELTADGALKPAAFKDVVAADYNNEHLAKNPYGTSFDMFGRSVTEDEQAAGMIKAYEAITFGMLHAIRITWEETEAEGGTIHESTYRVDTDKRLLQSGVRYIWNMELRRGTLAVIRTEILPWELNTDKEYDTDGIITE